MNVMKNVGTDVSPVSWLHERAVALLYDQLTQLPFVPFGNLQEGVRVRLAPGGDLSHDLAEGVHSVIIPGEWDNVGGIVPDLILKDQEGNPVRIIEVIVTAPPTEDKQTKLERLKTRGVDVVEVTVKTERDLLNLCWTPYTPKFADHSAQAYVGGGRGRRITGIKLRNGERYQGPFKSQRLASKEADQQVESLIKALVSCSPAQRRRFLEVCNALNSLDSLIPVHPLNPLRERLSAHE